ncbi:MAG: TetR/AcrR family transcriptional regulator [Proteobacteria bacterium]|nr:TetR/AcrR family transcriptional regulator [Pseudomonadota bacterium]
MSYTEFKEMIGNSKQDICREAFNDNKKTIRVKKEKTVVKNLEKILDAVFAISQKKGFQAMSMRDLSRESGLSMGALYSYFSSKAELLKMIQKQGRKMIIPFLEECMEGDVGSTEKLKRVVRTHIYLSEFARSWFYFMFMEAKNISDKERKKNLEMEFYTEKLLIDILEQGMKEGVFNKRDSAMTASMIKAMQQDWYLKRWKYHMRDISVEEYADFVLEFIDSFCVKRD